MPPQRERFSNICGASYQGEIRALKIGDDIEYICYDEEKCPSTGRPHDQYFVKFTRQFSFKQVKSMLGNCNFQRCNGSSDDNIKYCQKGEQSKEEYQAFGEKGVNHGIKER